MILTESKRDVTNTLTGETRQFTIKSNAKAFRILVDGLYSDKVGSIVRELTSNAYDAHVRRGNLDVPFEVRLPNSLNPNFSVRDYGCSMTHDEVMGLYSTLFESSKSTSNDEVGAFGLGAKSFLAYTDACTVNCWLGGELRAYLVALDQSGVPAVTLVHRAPSSEHQGVEVTFAVAHGDFGLFQRALSTAAYGYNKPPKILGGEITVLDPVFTGPGWRMYKGLSGGSKVRQGCAVYPISDHVYVSSLPHNYQLIVDVSIGDVDVTASRESLSPTVPQKRVLEQKFRAAVQEMNAQVQAQYKALPTELEKAWFAYRNRDLLGNGNWPTTVHTPVSLVQWKSDAPYSQWNVDRIARIKIVIDDGTVILRRQRRLKALSLTCDLYVTDDVKAAAIVKATLGMDPNQVVTIGNIPDVYIPTRGPSAPRAKKVVEPTRVWCLGERNKRWAGSYHWNVNNDRHLGVGYNDTRVWIDKVVTDTNALGLLVLTQTEHDKAVKAGKISENYRLDKVIEREVLLHGHEVRHSIMRDEAVRGLHVAHARQLMLAKAGLSAPATATTWMNSLFESMHPTVFKGYHAEGVDARRKLAVQYPLLFGYDDSAVDLYVKAMDELWADR